MTKPKYDVSAVWKRPYWPGSVAIIAVDAILLVFIGTPAGILLGDAAFAITVLWTVFVVIIADPRRRSRSPQTGKSSNGA